MRRSSGIGKQSHTFPGSSSPEKWENQAVLQQMIERGQAICEDGVKERAVQPRHCSIRLASFSIDIPKRRARDPIQHHFGPRYARHLCTPRIILQSRRLVPIVYWSTSATQSSWQSCEKAHLALLRPIFSTKNKRPAFNTHQYQRLCSLLQDWSHEGIMKSDLVAKAWLFSTRTSSESGSVLNRPFLSFFPPDIKRIKDVSL